MPRGEKAEGARETISSHLDMDLAFGSHWRRRPRASHLGDRRTQRARQTPHALVVVVAALVLDSTATTATATATAWTMVTATTDSAIASIMVTATATASIASAAIIQTRPATLTRTSVGAAAAAFDARHNVDQSAFARASVRGRAVLTQHGLARMYGHREQKRESGQTK